MELTLCGGSQWMLTVPVSGRIVVIGKEPHLPYDRIKLSKAMTASVESILLRPEEFYKERDIELLLGKEVRLLSFIPAEHQLMRFLR